MYVTRPFSMYKEDPGELLVPPPLVPNSGYLVIREEILEENTCCWEWDSCVTIKNLPFAQNMLIATRDETTPKKFLFIPVLDLPLFSNRYYVILADGKYTGQAYRCSTEEDMENLCFRNVVQDVEPKPFNYMDVYHQVEIRKDDYNRFYAKSISPDGFPPGFLREKGWEPNYAPLCPELDEAQGLNSFLREHLPDFDFPISSKCSSPIVVGKWYSPFVFVREEGISVKNQMKRSTFYEITLEQYWEEIYTKSNDNGEQDGDYVNVNVSVQREANYIDGEEVVRDGGENGHGGGVFIWFKSLNEVSGKRVKSVGLSFAITEAMKWVQKEGGWVHVGDERSVRIEKRVEKNDNEGSGWRRFGCYVLVERFVFKRMDKSIVLQCVFGHTHITKSKWDQD